MPYHHRLLDLCCGAGGAGVGYHRAGFDVLGVDTDPQRNNPLPTVVGDALTYPLDGFDAVHASPPCQAYSALGGMHPTLLDDYVQLIEPLRERFRAAGIPYIIENVPGAPLIDPVLMCGSMFKLQAGFGWLKRHRLFECSFPVHPLACSHPVHLPCRGVYGHGGHGDKHRMCSAYEARVLLDISWMNRDEMAQAIPPAYTEYIGHALRRHLDQRTVRRPKYPAPPSLLG